MTIKLERTQKLDRTSGKTERFHAFKKSTCCHYQAELILEGLNLSTVVKSRVQRTSLRQVLQVLGRHLVECQWASRCYVPRGERACRNRDSLKDTHCAGHPTGGPPWMGCAFKEAVQPDDSAGCRRSSVQAGTCVRLPHVVGRAAGGIKGVWDCSGVTRASP